MYPLNTTDAVKTEFYAALRQSHRVRVRVELLDETEAPVDSLTFPESAVLEGSSIEVDVTRAGATRLLKLEVVSDVDQWFFDLADPTHSTIWVNNYLKVYYGVWVAAVGDFVEIPVGVYCITGASVKDKVLSISGADKAARFMDPCKTWSPNSQVKRTMGISAAIRALLAWAGETKLRINDQTKAVGKDLSFPPGSEIWTECTKLAASVGWALFYDGDGYATFRARASAPVYVFAVEEGVTDGVVLEPLQITYQPDELRNCVRVTGAAGVTATALPARSHPLHPLSLRPSGGLYMPLFYENTAINRASAAQTAADDLLARGLAAVRAIEFPSLVIPTLEEYDYVAIDDDRSHIHDTMALERFSIPLSVTDSMTFGSKYSSVVRA